MEPASSARVFLSFPRTFTKTLREACVQILWTLALGYSSAKNDSKPLNGQVLPHCILNLCANHLKRALRFLKDLIGRIRGAFPKFGTPWSITLGKEERFPFDPQFTQELHLNTPADTKSVFLLTSLSHPGPGRPHCRKRDGDGHNPKPKGSRTGGGHRLAGMTRGSKCKSLPPNIATFLLLTA
jgi:hypothetical protein